MTEYWKGIKDPHDIKDYGIIWNDYLNSDTITSSNWKIPDGLTKVNSFHTETTTTVWLSGGTHNQAYPCTNEIVMSSGREQTQTVWLMVRNR